MSKFVSEAVSALVSASAFESESVCVPGWGENSRETSRCYCCLCLGAFTVCGVSLESRWTPRAISLEIGRVEDESSQQSKASVSRK